MKNSSFLNLPERRDMGQNGRRTIRLRPIRLREGLCMHTCTFARTLCRFQTAFA